jgi:hypothetical protein
MFMAIKWPWRKDIPLTHQESFDFDEESFEIKKSSSSKKSFDFVNKKAFKNFMVKAVGFVHAQTQRREWFNRPEFNLQEIRDAAEADSYVKISLSKTSYLIYKAGWKFKGENQDAIDYLEQRFKIMSYCTNVPMDILMQGIADDLVKYSNAFLLKCRVEKIPGVKATPLQEDGMIVGGYTRIDPCSIRIKRDKHGNIMKYEQGYGGNKKQFKPEDVIHFYLDKDANNAFGTPRIIAALEDVKLLRKIEGNVTALIYRFAMPLYQWKIGIPEIGFQGTDEEIAKAKYEIESGSLDGVFITNEKTEIRAIGSEGTAMNMQPYLAYFENRVFSALGVSAAQMGRGGAKQDADSMEQQVHDTVKFIQRMMSEFIEKKMLMELLLEGGFNPFEKDSYVDYVFEEISLETQIKKENHEINKYQSNVTNYHEARRRMGLKDESDDDEQLFNRKITDESTLRQIDRTAEHQLELARVNNAAKAATGSSSSSGKKKASSAGTKKTRVTKDKGPSGRVRSIDRPQNQYGTHSVKVKESLDESLVTEQSREYQNILNIYYDLKSDLKSKEIKTNIHYDYTRDVLIKKYKTLVDRQSAIARADAIQEINDVNDLNNEIPTESIDLINFYEEIEKSLSNILVDIKNSVTKENMNDVFDKNEYRLLYLLDYIQRKVYWYSYIKTGALVGITKVYILFSSKEDEKEHESIIDTDKFTIEDVPSYHSFCNCKVTYNKNDKGGE